MLGVTTEQYARVVCAVFPAMSEMGPNADVSLARCHARYWTQSRLIRSSCGALDLHHMVVDAAYRRRQTVRLATRSTKFDGV